MIESERIGVTRKRLPFTQIENAVLEDRALGKEHLLVYWTLAYHADSEGEHCWPSFATIAQESRCSRSKVIEVIADLVKAGYVQKEARRDKAGDRTSNAYVLLGKRGGSLRETPPQSAPETTGSPPGGPELYSSEQDSMNKREDSSSEGIPSSSLAVASAPAALPLLSESFPEKMAKKAGKPTDSAFMAKVSGFLTSHAPSAIEKAIEARLVKGSNPYFIDEAEIWKHEPKKAREADPPDLLSTCTACGSVYQTARPGGCNYCEDHPVKARELLAATA